MSTTSASAVDRNILEVALHLGRCLVVETRRSLAYRASRQDACEYSKFMASFYGTHASIMIDRQLWESASMTLNDSCNLELQMIEHIVGLAPHTILCQSLRKQTIDRVNAALKVYCGAMQAVVESFADPVMEQTYLTNTLAKTTRDSRLALLEKSLIEIKATLLKLSNFSMLEQGLLTEPTEGLDNAIHYDSDAILQQYPHDASFFTAFVAEEESNDEQAESKGGAPSSFYFNIAYPRYIPPRTTPSGKRPTRDDASYVEMDQSNVAIANNLIFRVALPLREMMLGEGTNVRVISSLSKLPPPCAAVEMLCAGLLDLYSRNVLNASVVRRYLDNLVYFLAGYNLNSFDVPTPATTDSPVTTQMFASREMCFLMPLSSYAFVVRPDTTSVIDECFLTVWNEKTVLSLKQVEQQYGGGKAIKSLAELPPDVYAVPLASCYAQHEAQHQEFVQILQGMSNKVVLHEIEKIGALPMVGPNQEPRLHVPDIMDASFYDTLRLLDTDGSTHCKNLDAFPKFLYSNDRKVALSNAKWHVKTAVELAKEQFKIVVDPNKGWGSALRSFERSLQSRHVDQFMEHFAVLLDKMVELFSSEPSLFKGFVTCKNLVRGASSYDMRLKLVDGFSKAMDDAAPSISKYCSTLNIMRTIDSRVRTAVKLNLDEREERFRTRLRETATSSFSGDEDAATQSSDDAFDSEKVIVFQWDDLTVSDPPSDIVAYRNSIRQEISLAQIARSIDENLAKNTMLASTNLSLNLAASLQSLACREMLAEDASSSEMASLQELHEYWKQRPSATAAAGSPQETLNIWLSDILYVGPLDPVAEPMHRFAWFKIEPYLRRMLVDSWYLDANSEELSLSSKQCRRAKIAVAPLSDRRRPLLLDANGPLSIVLDLINSLCINAVQFTKTHLSDNFSELIEKIYNASRELKSRRTEFVTLVMPKFVTADENGVQLERFSDEIYQTDDTETAKTQAVNFFQDAIMVLMYQFPRIQDGLKAFSDSANIGSLTILVRCLRIIVELIFSLSATHLNSLSMFQKNRIFAAWTVFRKAVQSHPSGTSEALNMVKVIELQNVMMPAPLSCLLTSYFGDVLKLLNKAHQDMDSNLDEKKISTLLNSFILPFLRLIKRNSNEINVAEMISIKSEVIQNAFEGGQSVAEFITAFVDGLDSIGQ